MKPQSWKRVGRDIHKHTHTSAHNLELVAMTSTIVQKIDFETEIENYKCVNEVDTWKRFNNRMTRRYHAQYDRQKSSKDALEQIPWGEDILVSGVKLLMHSCIKEIYQVVTFLLSSLE